MVEDGLDVSIEGGQCGPDLALDGSDEGECKSSRARHDFTAVSGSDAASIPAFPIKPALPAVFEEEFDVLKQRLLMDLAGEEVTCAALVETVRDVASGGQGMGGDRHAVQVERIEQTRGQAGAVEAGQGREAGVGDQIQASRARHLGAAAQRPISATLRPRRSTAHRKVPAIFGGAPGS